MKDSTENEIRKVFVISLLVKALISVVEVSAGVALFFTRNLDELATKFLGSEMFDDVSALHIAKIAHFAAGLSDKVQMFIALYLFSRGLVKVVLIWGMLKNKLWAYPFAIAVIIFFMFFQVKEYIHHHSTVLAVVTIFDVFVLALIIHEYRYMKKKLGITK
jgi:uncharacterized membrane protein